MKQAFLILFFLNLSFLGFCQKTEQTKSIDNYLQDVMKTYEIPGLAVGVVKNDKIIFQKYYGRESLEDDKKVDCKHNFRQLDALTYAKDGTLEQVLDELYPESE